MNYIAENFYYSLLDSLSEEIKLNIDEFKKIYPFVSGVCCLNYKEQPQSMVYRYAEAMKKNLCKLKSAEWLDYHRDFKEYRQPLLERTITSSDGRKVQTYGDLSNTDGSFDILLENYNVIIIVYDSHRRYEETCKFVFEFDENNEESMKLFYDYFGHDIVTRYHKELIKIRVNQLLINETKEIRKIHQEFIKL